MTVSCKPSADTAKERSMKSVSVQTTTRSPRVRFCHVDRLTADTGWQKFTR